MYSLVSRPFHRPVFDRLQYAKTASDQKLDGGKAWEQGYSNIIISYDDRQKILQFNSS